MYSKASEVVGEKLNRKTSMSKATIQKFINEGMSREEAEEKLEKIWDELISEEENHGNL